MDWSILVRLSTSEKLLIEIEDSHLQFLSEHLYTRLPTHVQESIMLRLVWRQSGLTGKCVYKRWGRGFSRFPSHAEWWKRRDLQYACYLHFYVCLHTPRLSSRPQAAMRSKPTSYRRSHPRIINISFIPVRWLFLTSEQSRTNNLDTPHQGQRLYRVILRSISYLHTYTLIRPFMAEQSTEILIHSTRSKTLNPISPDLYSIHHRDDEQS